MKTRCAAWSRPADQSNPSDLPDPSDSAGPSDLPLDVGRSAEIPAAIRRAVILRDQHCRWAGGYFL
ncbi:MAG: hypothetical protein ACRDOA_00210 [Streptosporangiaceae bacterium]